MEHRKRRKFTPEEDRVLLELYGNISTTLLAARMKRHYQSVIYRAGYLRRLGYDVRKRGNRALAAWTAPCQVQPGICLVHRRHDSKYIAASKPILKNGRFVCWAYIVGSFARAVEKIRARWLALHNLVLVSEWEKHYGRRLT
jgi:hypothetical protein